jgi:hypothetical protein
MDGVIKAPLVVIYGIDCSCKAGAESMGTLYNEGAFWREKERERNGNHVTAALLSRSHRKFYVTYFK